MMIQVSNWMRRNRTPNGWVRSRNLCNTRRQPQQHPFLPIPWTNVLKKRWNHTLERSIVPSSDQGRTGSWQYDCSKRRRKFGSHPLNENPYFERKAALIHFVKDTVWNEMNRILDVSEERDFMQRNKIPLRKRVEDQWSSRQNRTPEDLEKQRTIRFERRKRTIDSNVKTGNSIDFNSEDGFKEYLMSNDAMKSFVSEAQRCSSEELKTTEKEMTEENTIFEGERKNKRSNYPILLDQSVKIEQDINVSSGVRTDVSENVTAKNSLSALLDENESPGIVGDNKGTGDSLLGLLNADEESFSNRTDISENVTAKNSLSALLDENESPGIVGDDKGTGDSLLDLLNADEESPINRDTYSIDSIESPNELPRFSNWNIYPDDSHEVETTEDFRDISNECSAEIPYLLAIDEVIEKAKVMLIVMNADERNLYTYYQDIQSEGRNEGFMNELAIEKSMIDHPFVNVINELLLGSNLSKWPLSTVEFNTILALVATSAFYGKENTLLEIYHHMKELEGIGLKDSAPNSDTYTIMLNFFRRSEHGNNVSIELASMLLLDKEESDSFFLDEDAFKIGIKVFVEQLDTKSAEKLLRLALEQGLYVDPEIFKSMLSLYKGQYEEEKSLEIVQLCIQVRYYFIVF